MEVHDPMMAIHSHGTTITCFPFLFSMTMTVVTSLFELSMKVLMDNIDGESILNACMYRDSLQKQDFTMVVLPLV